MSRKLKVKVIVAAILVVTLALVVTAIVYPKLLENMAAAAGVVGIVLVGLFKKKATPEQVAKEAEEARERAETRSRQETEAATPAAVAAAGDADGHVSAARDAAAESTGAGYIGEVLDRSAGDVQRIFGNQGDSSNP